MFQRLRATLGDSETRVFLRVLGPLWASGGSLSYVFSRVSLSQGDLGRLRKTCVFLRVPALRVFILDVFSRMRPSETL